MSNINERITTLRNYKDMNQKEFSEFIECPRSSLSEIENGKRIPNIALIVGISNRFKEINTDWLLTGEGEMLKSTPTNKHYGRRVDDIGDNTENTAKPVQKAVSLLNELTPQQQQEILAAIEEKKRLNEMQRMLDILASEWRQNHQQSA